MNISYCPDCISYNTECSVDTEDWNEPCKYYSPRYITCEVCGETYDVDVGCIKCETRKEAEGVDEA